jgi:hypothetical protein
MTSRLLPKEEWFRLEGTQLETVVPILPEGAQVMVVESEGQIQACVALYPLWHLEGIEIKSPSATRLLLASIRTQTATLPAVLSWAQHAKVGEFLRRLGAEPLPGEHFAWKP